MRKLFDLTGMVAVGVAILFAVTRNPTPTTVERVDADNFRWIDQVDAQGNLHGKCLMYFPNGQLRSEWRFAHGLIMEATYWKKNGELAGRQWDENGRLRSEPSVISQD